MFYINVGRDHQIARDLDTRKGAILLPAHVTSERMERERDVNCTSAAIDPQLYLATLDGKDCSKTCAKLCTFPWFLVENVPELDEEATLTEWKAELVRFARENWPAAIPDGPLSARKALEYQDSCGCRILIAPAPLIVDGTDEGEAIAQWADWGIEARDELELEKPLMASIALDESILTDAVFAGHGLLDAVEDHITARRGLAGVYVVVNRLNDAHPFCISPNVARAYIEVSHRLSTCGLEYILVNFADILGLVCLAFGASDFATGESQSRRRLSLSGFKDTDGRRLPKYYAHGVAGEFYTEQDLDRIAEQRLVRQIRDVTPYSRALLEALESGRSASENVNWAENFSNDTFARRHFLHRMMEEAQRIEHAPSLDERRKLALDWMEDADMRQLFIRQKLADVSHELRGDFAPVSQWSEAARLVLATESATSR